MTLAERLAAFATSLSFDVLPEPVVERIRLHPDLLKIHAVLASRDHILSLIDGKRSLKDIAKLIVEQRLMSEHEAESAIRSFLIKMYDDSRRGTSY